MSFSDVPSFVHPMHHVLVLWTIRWDTLLFFSSLSDEVADAENGYIALSWHHWVGSQAFTQIGDEQAPSTAVSWDFQDFERKLLGYRQTQHDGKHTKKSDPPHFDQVLDFPIASFTQLFCEVVFLLFNNLEKIHYKYSLSHGFYNPCHEIRTYFPGYASFLFVSHRVEEKVYFGLDLICRCPKLIFTYQLWTKDPGTYFLLDVL